MPDSVVECLTNPVGFLTNPVEFLVNPVGFLRCRKCFDPAAPQAIGSLVTYTALPELLMGGAVETAKGVFVKG